MPPRSIKQQNGFSMVEVLVTIVVVSFGLLGFAGLLTQAVVDNRVAYMRSQATVLAYDITERMRANRASAVDGSYGIAIGSTPGGTTIEAIDLQGWKGMLSQMLPNGDGSVNVDGDGNTTIVIQWDEDGDGIVTQFTSQTSI